MNRERSVILGVLLVLFLGLSGLLGYRTISKMRDSFKAGAPPVKLKNYTVPANIPLSQLRPPALYPSDQVRYGTSTSVSSAILFGDYACEKCRNVEKSLQNILPKFNGKIRFIWRDMVREDDKLLEAAVFTHCAGLQGKFWEAHDLLMQSPKLTEMAYASIVSQLKLDRQATNDCRLNATTRGNIKRDSDLVQSDGVTSTPILFIGTRAFAGTPSEQELEQEIRNNLAN